MLKSQLEYLLSTIQRYISSYLTTQSLQSFNLASIFWCTKKDLNAPPPQTICIPIDNDTQPDPDDQFTVKFEDTSLTFWNRISPPNAHWTYDSSVGYDWYTHSNGSYTPSWALANTLFNLLILREESDVKIRDVHNRFLGSYSPRDRFKLLDRPIFNDAVASLVTLCEKVNYRYGKSISPLAERISRSPSIYLSHDIDIIYGNDLWTQLSRFGRLFRNNLSIQNCLKQLRYIVYNQIYPKQYYWNELLQMLEVERTFGYNSLVYLLNGKRGRYHARSTISQINRLVRSLPSDFNVGLHYNYDTYLNSEKLISQKKQLEAALSRDIKYGRAHYLRFDHQRSFVDYIRAGIEFDESLGYTDRIGFRSGIAAAYHPYVDSINNQQKILTIPLTIMDSAIFNHYGGSALQSLEDLFLHISRVGGALSVLWHPGQYKNPEFSETVGMYDYILNMAHKNGFVSGHKVTVPNLTS